MARRKWVGFELKKGFLDNGSSPDYDLHVLKLLPTLSLQNPAPPGPGHPNSDSAVLPLPVSPGHHLVIDMLGYFSVAPLYLLI